MADAASWLDDELDPPRRRPRPRVVVAAAVATVPWLVLAVLLLRGVGDPGPSAGTEVPSPMATDAAPDAPMATEGPDGPEAAPPPDGPEPAPPPDGSEPVPPPRADEPMPTTAEVGDAAAVAVAVARAWLSDAGPDLEVPGVEPARDAYLEHAVVQRVELPAPDAALVTLTAVLLVREEETYVDTVVRRVAVPLTVTATAAVPAGAPWWLPDEVDLTPRAPEVTPLDDPEVLAAVTSALTAAGYRDPEVDAVARGGGELLVASTEATTADGREVQGELWLREGSEGVTALGLGAPDVPVDADDPEDGS